MFNYILPHMQRKGLPAVIFQDKLIHASTNRSVLFAAVVADSLSQATNLIHTITNLPSVSGVESMVDYLAEDQTRKLAVLKEVKQLVADIRFEPIDPSLVEVDELDLTLYSLHGYCTLASNSPEVTQEPDLL